MQFEFFAGVPGSRWSGIAREIKLDPQYDTSDRAEHREYKHHGFSGHKEAYFGTGMEFNCDLTEENLCAPFAKNTTKLTKLLLSHEWPYYFDEIVELYPDAPITLVYRNNEASMDWWLEAGGWDITYPDYSWYKDDETMFARIREQNQLILDFAQKHMLQWKQHHNYNNNIFITTYKGN